MLILRHAWLNLWDKHMTTGRINQVSIVNNWQFASAENLHSLTASLDKITKGLITNPPSCFIRTTHWTTSLRLFITNRQSLPIEFTPEGFTPMEDCSRCYFYPDNSTSVFFQLIEKGCYVNRPFLTNRSKEAPAKYRLQATNIRQHSPKWVQIVIPRG